MHRPFRAPPRGRAHPRLLPALVALVALELPLPPPSRAAGPTAVANVPHYEVSASVDPSVGSIAGQVRIRFAAAERVLLHLYPNRFGADGDDEVNDMTRRYVYPRGDFAQGGIEIESVRSLPDGSELRFTIGSAPALRPDTLLDVALPAGREIAGLEIRFRTSVPERYGPFGTTEAGLVAVGGWHPYLVARDAEGAWQPTWPPEPASFSIEVAAPADETVVLGDAVFEPGHTETLRATATGVRNVALVVYSGASLVEEKAGETDLRFVAPEPRRAFRAGPAPGPDERFRATVASALAHRPASLPAPERLIIAQVPLRWNLATPSDAPIVLSDRAMHVHEVLGGFHAAQIAQAVYVEILRPHVLACESEGDREWVLQGMAWELADRFLAATEPDHRTVHDWISWLDVFAIVDRFESAPKVPFVQAFFENSLTADELRESVFTYGSDAAPARLTFARLEREGDAEAVHAAVDEYLAGIGTRCEPFATTLARAAREPADTVAAEVAVARTPPVPDGPLARVDPSLRPLRERSTYQFVLDNTEVDVSSSEFGFAALFVARKRHDYTRDLALDAYVTERSYGFRTGPRFHFGERNDPNTYRQNLFFYYTLAGLDPSFRDDSRPEIRDVGGVGGFGARYDYSNVYWYDNPTEQRELRVFVDGFDPSLGGDSSFLRYGARVRGTTKLGSPSTLLALELLGGFEESFSDAGVPIQEQYSLGGQRAIRGIAVDEELARNIGLARVELRQDVYPEWDLNLLDVLTYHRPQLRLFLDSGNVDDSAGRAVNPAHWALGAGVGVAVLYDFLGFFPGTAYLEVATRLDQDQDRVQVLFGTRQPF